MLETYTWCSSLLHCLPGSCPSLAENSPMAVRWLGKDAMIRSRRGC